MIAALIVAGVVTYAIIGGVVGAIHFGVYGGRDKGDSSVAGMFWPISAPVMLGVKLGGIVSRGLKG